MVVFGRHIRRLCSPLGGQCDCIEDGDGGDGMELAGPVQLTISRLLEISTFHCVEITKPSSRVKYVSP